MKLEMKAKLLFEMQSKSLKGISILKFKFQTHNSFVFQNTMTVSYQIFWNFRVFRILSVEATEWYSHEFGILNQFGILMILSHLCLLYDRGLKAIKNVFMSPFLLTKLNQIFIKQFLMRSLLGLYLPKIKRLILRSFCVLLCRTSACWKYKIFRFDRWYRYHSSSS